MELRHLRYFVAVAEELHFRRAAERLHMAQPPLSLQIAQLEEEIGCRLFDRSDRRRVRLTPAGESFLEEARPLLDRVQHAVESARRAQAGEIGTLTVGLTSSMAYGVVPGLVRTFRKQNPGVAIRLLEMTTAQQERALLDRRLDLGFCYPPLEHDGFRTAVVQEERLTLAVPESHPLARHREVRLRSLGPEAFLSFPRSLSPGLYDLILSACRQAELTPKFAQEATQLQTIIALVAAGLGVAIVPESMAALQRTGVVYRRLAGTRVRVRTIAVWRAAGPFPAMNRLVALAQKERTRPERLL
jgi:DNA-binding transcriptional LysR family regulator